MFDSVVGGFDSVIGGFDSVIGGFGRRVDWVIGCCDRGHLLLRPQGWWPFNPFYSGFETCFHPVQRVLG